MINHRHLIRPAFESRYLHLSFAGSTFILSFAGSFSIQAGTLESAPARNALRI